MSIIPRDFAPAFRSLAPGSCAILTFAAGVMLLISGETPSEHDRVVWLLQHFPAEVLNLSHFLSSLLGLVLVLLAWGLRERLDAAWIGSTIVSIAAAGLALFKGVNWEETAILAALAALLVSSRRAFPRHARLSRMEVSPGWMLSAFAMVAGASFLGLWSFKNVDYSDQLWWRVMADADAGRALRAGVGAGVLLMGFGVWRMIATPATPPVIGEDDPDFTRVRAILATAQDSLPEANLALLGDKRFLFSESGESFMMFGVRGRSWIALGGPIGKRCERADLLWRFRELADAHAARPAIYNVGPDDLPELIDMGFQLQKIGEFALVPLADFSVAGRRREVLRRNWRKAKEGGATFEVVEPEAVWSLMPELRRVSDSWLQGQPGGEKSFSLGGFQPAYLAEFPCALVRQNGRLVAFANLWQTSDLSAFSMDLMRYADDAPKNVMDYLFVELLLWGQAKGYTAFEFGVAPLAGLTGRPLAPMMSRLGRFVFERGEEFYNFQGVRRYKDKYDPIWQPRYIAASHKWSIPILLADVGLLSAGGVVGLKRRKGGDKAAPEPAPPAKVSQPEAAEVSEPPSTAPAHVAP